MNNKLQLKKVNSNSNSANKKPQINRNNKRLKTHNIINMKSQMRNAKEEDFEVPMIDIVINIEKVKDIFDNKFLYDILQGFE